MRPRTVGVNPERSPTAPSEVGADRSDTIEADRRGLGQHLDLRQTRRRQLLSSLPGKGGRQVHRTANGGIPITERHMEAYRGVFQPPTNDELSLFDLPSDPRASSKGG
jgi:hypothetical protein